MIFDFSSEKQNLIWYYEKSKYLSIVGFGGLILLGSVERTVKAYSPDYKTQYELYVGKTLKGRKLLDKNVIETLDSTGKWVEMKNETAQ